MVRWQAASIADLARSFFRGGTVCQMSGSCAAVLALHRRRGSLGPLPTALMESPLASLVLAVANNCGRYMDRSYVSHEGKDLPVLQCWLCKEQCHELSTSDHSGVRIWGL